MMSASQGTLVTQGYSVRAKDTQRLQSSSFWVMTYFLLRDYNIQPKKELLWSLGMHVCNVSEIDDDGGFPKIGDLFWESLL